MLTVHSVVSSVTYHCRILQWAIYLCVYWVCARQAVTVCSVCCICKCQGGTCVRGAYM